jgi:hypothetical protein
MSLYCNCSIFEKKCLITYGSGKTGCCQPKQGVANHSTFGVILCGKLKEKIRN